VLRATSLSHEEAKNSTSHRIKTPDPIEIKFGMVNYVSEMAPVQNFRQISMRGASLQIGEIYAKFLPPPRR